MNHSHPFAEEKIFPFFMPDHKDMEGGCFGSSVLGSSVVFVPSFCDIKKFKKISKISSI
jgi:hypothetical protein